MSNLDYGVVALSSAFEDEKLFVRTIEHYLPETSEVGIVAINDRSKLTAKCFAGRLVDSLAPSMNLREKRGLIKQAKFAIFFWDGTGVDDFVYLARLYKIPSKVVAVETTRVVNRDRGDEFDVYIGRGTPWGNPFAIGDNGADRAAVIEMYKAYFAERFINDAQGNRDIRTLKGKVLACHCKPSACHGDVIAAYLNSLSDDAN